MTGAPEAALARELRLCYSALALVTDMDAGAEGGTRGRPGGGLRAVPANLERLTGLLTAAIDGAARPGRLHLLDLGRRHRADLRACHVKVLLTGSAGFIGTAIGEVLEADGHEVVRVDLMLPMAHGAAEPPRRHPPASTSATPRTGPTCCAGSTRSATRRPWSAPG